MSLALVLLMLGLASGLVRGGSLANVGRARFRWPALVFAGLGLQVSAELIATFVHPGFRLGNRGIVVLGLSYLLLAVFVTLNRHLPGTLAIAAGLVLNLAVIMPNGGMPVSVDAARSVGLDPEAYLESAVKHRVLLPGTPLGFLGDVIPIRILRTVVSVGDVVLAAGIFRLVDALVRRGPRRSPGDERREPAPEEPEPQPDA
jgi:hypothetical protein